MWRLDEEGMPSPELRFVQEGVLLSFFCGAVWGAYTHSRRIIQIFLQKNKHEVSSVCCTGTVGTVTF
jgi:hypothetical protein